MNDKDIKWFHSEEGEKSFRDANSLQSRVLWIYQYLSILSQDNNPKSLLKLAYIMADQMWDSPHRFSGWPSIIDEKCNPFLNLVENGEIQEVGDLLLEARKHNDHNLRVLGPLYNKIGEFVAYKLLCALHGREMGFFSYEELTDYQEDETIYSIEREIIWLFCYNGQINSVINYEIGPYGMHSNNVEDNQGSFGVGSFNEISKMFDDQIESWSKEREISAKPVEQELSEKLLEHKEKKEDRKSSKVIIALVLIAATILLGVFISKLNGRKNTDANNYSNMPVDDNYEMVDKNDDNVAADIIGYAEVIVDELYIRDVPSIEGNKPKRFAEQNKVYEVFDIYYDNQFTWYKVGNDEWFADDDGKWVVFTPVSSN